MNTPYVKAVLGAILLSVSSSLFSQNVGINTTGATPSINAILDLNTGNTLTNLGLLLPHVSITALGTFNPPIANAAGAGDGGMMVYNTNAGIGSGIGIYVWNTTTNLWQFVGSPISGSGTPNYLARWTPNGTTLGIGVVQDNGTVAVISQAAAVFGTTAELTVGATAPETSAIIVPPAGGNVGFGNILPKSSAILDLTNTGSTGGFGLAFLWPTNPNPTANIVAPALGEEIYNTTTGCFQFYNGIVWQQAGCPCSTVPTQTVTPQCANPWGNEAVTYTSVASSAGVNYVWTAASNDGTPGLAGNGTGTITVTWPAYATTGTVTSTVSDLCGSNTITYTTAINRDSMTGPPSMFTTGSGIYSVVAGAGYTYAWTTSPAVTLSSTTTQTVSASNPASNFTITCNITGAAVGGVAGCSESISLPVLVAACTGSVSVDPNTFSSSTTAWTATVGRFGTRYQTTSNLSVVTTDNNDLVMVVLTDQDGGFRFFNQNGTAPTVTANTVRYQYNGGALTAATIYQPVANAFYMVGTAGVGAAPIIIYSFPAPTAGTYSITVAEPGNYNNGQEMNFAVALTGFCSAPTSADILGYAVGYYTACGSNTGIPTSGISIACPVGGYILMAINNIYPTGGAGGTQSYQSLSGPNPLLLQENVGIIGYSNTTASIGGTPEAGGVAAGTLLEGIDNPLGFCTGTVAGIVIH